MIYILFFIMTILVIHYLVKLFFSSVIGVIKMSWSVIKLSAKIIAAIILILFLFSLLK